MSTSKVEYCVEVRASRPLVVDFAILNPPGADGAVRVPRLLLPPGAFVELVVRRGAKEVWRTHRPKLHLKLDPSRPEAYLALEPGHSYGARLETDAPLEPGEHLLDVSYSSAPFDGDGGPGSGPLRHRATLSLRVE